MTTPVRRCVHSSEIFRLSLRDRVKLLFNGTLHVFCDMKVETDGSYVEKLTSVSEGDTTIVIPSQRRTT